MTLLHTQEKHNYRPDDFLSRAIEKSKAKSNVIIQFPVKFFKKHKDVCKFKHHESFGSELEPCEKHGDTRVCSGLEGHVCLECHPHLKRSCKLCGGKLYGCCC